MHCFSCFGKINRKSGRTTPKLENKKSREVSRWQNISRLSNRVENGVCDVSQRAAEAEAKAEDELLEMQALNARMKDDEEKKLQAEQDLRLAREQAEGQPCFAILLLQFYFVWF